MWLSYRSKCGCGQAIEVNVGVVAVEVVNVGVVTL